MKTILTVALIFFSASLTYADFKSDFEKANQLRKEKNYKGAMAAFQEAEKSAVSSDEKFKTTMAVANCMHFLKQTDRIPSEYKKIYDGNDFSQKQKNEAMRSTLQYAEGKLKGEIGKRLANSPDITMHDCMKGRDAWAQWLVSQKKYTEAIEVLKAKNDFPNYKSLWKADTWLDVSRIYSDNLNDEQAALTAVNEAVKICRDIQNDPKFRADWKPEYREKELAALAEHPLLFDQLKQESLKDSADSKTDIKRKIQIYRKLAAAAIRFGREKEGSALLEQAAENVDFPADDRLIFYLDLIQNSYRGRKPIGVTRAYLAKAQKLEGLSEQSQKRLEFQTKMFSAHD